MQRVRVAAFGLAVVLFFLAEAPAATAENVFSRGERTVVNEPRDWIVGLLEQLAEWVGWEDVTPRATREAGSPKEPKGPSGPLATGDCGMGLGPDGSPCHE